MLTAVFLHGHLGEKYGKKLMLDVECVAGAVALLKANFSSFARDLIGRGNRYRVTVGKSAIGKRELANPANGQDIHIVPIIAGSGGNNGVFNIIAGIVLIIVGVLLEGSDGGYLIQAGVGMLIGGVISYISYSSMPKVSLAGVAQGEKKGSRYFNGPINVTAQGNPVPVLYGRLLVGSQVISGGFSDEEY